MHQARLTVTGVLRLLSPLHVGSGHEREDSNIRQLLAEAEQAEAQSIRINAVMRDHRDQPCIPGSTLKGALRDQLAAEALAADDVFGVASTQEGQSRMGRLHLYLATLEQPASKEEGAGLPYFGTTGEGLFVKAQTAIDRETGTAERHKLFHAEMVAAGATFTFSCCWLIPQTNADKAEECRALARVLAPLVAESGLAVGRNTRQGLGRLRLDMAEPFSAHWQGLNASGNLDQADQTDPLRHALATAPQPTSSRHEVTLALACDGPYHTTDPARRQRGQRRFVAEEETRAIPCLTRNGRPVLWASSLVGALRARAAWLVELSRLQGETCWVPADRESNSPVDDRTLETVLPATWAVTSATEAATRLSSVERLFGVPGWRGRLEVTALSWQEDGGNQRITNVCLDRFTGGALTGALFTTEVVMNPRFTATLALDSRGLTASDQELFTALRENLERDGLFLGAKAAKGYGWFTITTTDSAREAA